MENPAATLYCPNIRCQAANSQSNNFCQKCRTPLLRRYLWAMGQGVEAYQPGQVIGDRYWVVNSRVILDTQPILPPDTPDDIPQDLLPYLKLSPYRLHIPQVYGYIFSLEKNRHSQIWLLEDAPIQEAHETETQGQLWPELSSVWSNAPAMRQLNWLWQIANLWQPLSSEGVASSLLTPKLVRVEGTLVRLLELRFDSTPAPTLQHLGQLWLQLAPSSHPSIASFVQQLCTQLSEGQIRSTEALVAQLDQALQACGRSQSRSYQIFTQTDSGPSRPQNEDACYPPSGQLIHATNKNALAIVCDGIGGHEGGEVASHLAINTLWERLTKLPNTPELSNPANLTWELEQATCAANDLISQQNDSERRSERQRMGTTLVMTLVAAHEIYIAHVGDSRVYWITRHNCHQITLDDDLASREVRLGYALYRDAVQQPTSGSLVQALGMGSSATLHPTVQRLMVDEDCVFLLCSDGLSDFDRVEQYWQTEILPILDGQRDVQTATARLMEIANTQNGHDNVTVALVHCQVTPMQGTGQTELSVQQLATPSPSVTPRAALPTKSVAPSQMKTQQLPTRTPRHRTWLLLLSIIVLSGLAGGLAFLLLPRPWLEPLVSQGSRPTPAPPPANSSPTPSPSPLSASDINSVIQVTNSTTQNTQGNEIRLVLRRDLPPQDQSIVGLIPTGSVLQVIDKLPDTQQVNWLKLAVCTSGSGSPNAQPSEATTSSGVPPQSQAQQSPATSNPGQTSAKRYRLVTQGDVGWIRETDVLPNVEPLEPTAQQPRECVVSTPSTPSPASTASP